MFYYSIIRRVAQVFNGRPDIVQKGNAEALSATHPITDPEAIRALAQTLRPGQKLEMSLEDFYSRNWRKLLK